MRSLLALLLPITTALAADPAPVAVRLSGAPGLYATEQWKRDWPGCEFEAGVEEKRISLVERDGARWLRVTFQPGEIGPDKNGAGWRMPFARRESAELSYRMRFGPQFEWVKGGKLPGLAGGSENVSGGQPANGKNGWSARLMWRADGRGEAYVYHLHQPSNYGESFRFPDDFRFPTDADFTVRIRVTMNTPGQRNGTLQVWIATVAGAERQVVNRSDLAWRAVDSFGVDSIYFDTFYGGGSRDWAPTRASWAEFGELKVTTP